MKRETKSLISYTYSHFAVDFTCFYILFGYILRCVTVYEYAIFALVYNVIAFGMQVLIGGFCDQKRNFKSGLFGGMLVLFALIFPFVPWVALAFCSVGNAFFHVGGGIDSLVYSNGKTARGGIFVSTGAVGLILGTLLGKFAVDSPTLYAVVPAILMIVANLAMWKFGMVKGENESPKMQVANAGISYKLVLIFSLATIVLRSFIGSTVPISWNVGWLIVLPSCSACLGKALGGILGDRFGVKKVGTASLLISIPLIIFGTDVALICVLGLVLFNMSMPLTLGIIFSAMGDSTEGLSFGLTTLALLIGHIATALLVLENSEMKILLTILLAISALLIFLSAGKRTAEKI